ncbi:hypothetical protein C7S15_5127 [Burkholderia cepacia]|nr:hypothetical protein [Burkholderia cepacia]
MRATLRCSAAARRTCVAARAARARYRRPCGSGSHACHLASLLRINDAATTPSAGIAGQSSPGRHAATRRP